MKSVAFIQFAIKRSGASAAYKTTCKDPGILICPTRLPNATLYVLTSESTGTDPILITDLLSGTNICVNLKAGRAALLLVNRNGQILASYNVQ